MRGNARVGHLDRSLCCEGSHGAVWALLPCQLVCRLVRAYVWFLSLNELPDFEGPHGLERVLRSLARSLTNACARARLPGVERWQKRNVCHILQKYGFTPLVFFFGFTLPSARVFKPEHSGALLCVTVQHFSSWVFVGFFRVV